MRVNFFWVSRRRVLFVFWALRVLPVAGWGLFGVGLRYFLCCCKTPSMLAIATFHVDESDVCTMLSSSWLFGFLCVMKQHAE